MTALLPTLLAHAGHWAVDLAIYLGPMAVIVAVLKLGDRRRRREAAEAAEIPPAAAPPPAGTPGSSR